MFISRIPFRWKSLFLQHGVFQYPLTIDLFSWKLTFLVVDRILDYFLELLQLKVSPFNVGPFVFECQLGYFRGSAVAQENEYAVPKIKAVDFIMQINVRFYGVHQSLWYFIDFIEYEKRSLALAYCVFDSPFNKILFKNNQS